MLSDIAQKNILVYGLGKTGMSVVKNLSENNVSFSVFDSRDNPPNLSEFTHTFPNHKLLSQSDLMEKSLSFDLVILSPGVPRSSSLVQNMIDNGVGVIGDVELFSQQAMAPVIAITGSNGKSTVTSLLGEMIKGCGYKVQVGGNLGVPALDLLHGPVPDYYVLELSSFQLESVFSLNAAVSVVLNISADHMDRYASLDDYADVKSRVYDGNGIMVINADDPYVSAMSKSDRHCVCFTAEGRDSRVTVKVSDQAITVDDHNLIDLDQIGMSGMHNYANCAAAVSIGHSINLPLDSMANALRRFNGLSHRNELILESNGVKWINDSKGTNVGASAAALKGVEGKAIFIAGGVGKGADFTPLRQVIEDKAVGVILMGVDRDIIANAIGKDIPIHFANDMHHAIELASTLSKPGMTVLLSPACASFDMYSSFEQRGDDFRRCVLELVA